MKGKEDHIETVRITKHGPVISNLIDVSSFISKV